MVSFPTALCGTVCNKTNRIFSPEKTLIARFSKSRHDEKNEDLQSPIKVEIEHVHYLLYIRAQGSQAQGCQMVYFQTKHPNLGKFWSALEWKRLVYFLAIGNILWILGTSR
jgi:hypothetical protein